MKVKLDKYINEVNIRNKNNIYNDVYSVTNSEGFVESKEYFSKEVFSKDLSNYKIVMRNMMAYNPSRINVGSVAIQNKKETVIVSPLYIIFSVNQEYLLVEYLNYFLHSNIGLNQIKFLTSGSVRDNLKFSSLKNLLMPIEDIHIQKKRIEILKKLDSLISLKKFYIDKLNKLISSLFIEMFGSQLENPYNFEKGIIKDVVSDVKYGTSSPANDNGIYPYLRMGNITYDGQLDLTNLKYITIDDKELDKYIVKKGDILFNRTNSKELVGKTCVFNLDEPMIIAGYIIRVRTNNRVIPEYLSAVLNSKYGKQTLFDMCKSIVGQANINAQELQKIKLLVPPIEIQLKYKSYLVQIDKSKYASGYVKLIFIQNKILNIFFS